MRTVEPLGEPNPDALGLPDMALMLSDVLVVFDHLRHTVTVLANVDATGRRRGAYARAARRSPKCARGCAGPLPRPAGAGARRTAPTFGSNMPRERSRRWSPGSSSTCMPATPSRSCRRSAGRRAVAVEPFSIYRGLRAVNPSPYMYFLDFERLPDRRGQPRAAAHRHGRRVSTRPIAGTRPRGGDAEDDARIAEELLADPKERAEHVMLVDLGRNDLGRVCEYGSVSVDTFMAVETYSHVMHIVSSVGGRLREDVGPWTRCARCCPPGR